MLPEEIFPYPSFRDGQKELANSVHLACKNGGRLVAEAMSGFGKTAAVLAGGLSAATDDDLLIVYACRTKRQVFRVMEELERFAEKLPIQATSLFSKYDYCLLRHSTFEVSPETFKWYCGFQTSNNLCSYFLNVPFNRDKVEALAEDQANGPGSFSDLLKESRNFHVCPYEVARLSLAKSRIIVTTYHYLFDEDSRSTMIGRDTPLSRVVAVVDEAHNIREFVSDNSTVSLTLSDISRAVEDSKRLFLPRISSAVSDIRTKAIQFASSGQGWLLKKRSFVDAITAGHSREWLSDLVFELSTTSGVAWYSVATNRNLPTSIVKLGGFLSALLASLDTDDVQLSKSPDALFLTDTHSSKRFLKAVGGLRSLVLLSATINPPDLFMRSIGLGDTSTKFYSATTAHKFRIRTVIDCSVTTKFKTRSSDMYSKIAKRIMAVSRSTSGGIGVFLPSYAVLESIRDLLCPLVQDATTDGPIRDVLVERPRLTNEDSEEIMAAFKSSRSSILLAIQGGRFSEGEDFPGNQMDVSIVVGLPLRPPSPTVYAEFKQMQEDRFDKHQAYLVLSLLPALRKAIQCAGRHVREPGKVGMVYFMDARFAEQRIVDLLPSWLREDLVKGEFDPESIASVTREFFSSASRH